MSLEQALTILDVLVEDLSPRLGEPVRVELEHALRQPLRSRLRALEHLHATLAMRWPHNIAAPVHPRHHGPARVPAHEPSYARTRLTTGLHENAVGRKESTMRCTTGWSVLVSAALSGPSGLFPPWILLVCVCVAGLPCVSQRHRTLALPGIAPSHCAEVPPPPLS